MIQDIAPHNLDNQFVPDTKPSDDSPVFCFRKNELLIRSDGEDFRLPTYSDFPDKPDVQYLLSLDGKGFFLYEPEVTEWGDYFYTDVRSLKQARLYPQHKVFTSMTAYQLARWYRDNKYCGTCGHETVHGTRERSIKCPECGRTIYPRIIPAVIVAVRNDDKLLVTKYAGRNSIPYYALVAGFTEIGETLEETVAREVMEETGLKVKNITYYKSQPWGVVDDILTGFYCDVDGDDTIVMDEGELAVAKWVQREDLELQPDNFSLTGEMIRKFKEKRSS